MRCLLIDNYDSFTWMLADCIGQVFGEPATVLRNDQLSWAEICQQVAFDCIVISPGPGSVVNAADFNVAAQAVLQNDVPVFGVCLGFHGIAYFHGCQIAHAPVPFHGRTSAILHGGAGLFAGIPTPFNAVRYHSLIVAPPLASDIVATAHSESGAIMALEHRSLPKWGVQFHPESILTEHGLQIIANFRDLAHRRRNSRAVGVMLPSTQAATAAPVVAGISTKWQVLVREVEVAVGVEALFAALFAEQEHSFWLDSQLTMGGMAEFSFMGAVDAGDVLAYHLESDPDGVAGQKALAELERELASVELSDHAALPFAFRGGLIGYLSYEMKALFGGERRYVSSSPDLLWMRVKRFVVVDRVCGRGWVIALARSTDMAPTHAWVESTVTRMLEVGASPTPAVHSGPARGVTAPRLEISLDLNREQYLAAIASCQRAIVEGESYEVCLTNRFRLSASLDPWALYARMRAGNPAPFGAFVKSGKHSVLSTSPERFLKVDVSGEVQAKPIKGTAPRSDSAVLDALSAQSLSSSPKERAENLMIVDLMRSDLSRVAEPGSIRVPVLMDVESYQTVHQLVSTVTAKLRPECSLIDLLRATFPGGSISGAPKIRTLQIIDQLERSPRGVYCGAIGYLGYGRVADLSMGIRTVTYDGSTLSFGAGGAITHLSDAEAEFREMLLKADAVLRPIWQHLTGASSYTVTYLPDTNQMQLEPVAEACGVAAARPVQR
jgi:para-aminobenzoate synthetase